MWSLSSAQLSSARSLTSPIEKLARGELPRKVLPLHENPSALIRHVYNDPRQVSLSRVVLPQMPVRGKVPQGRENFLLGGVNYPHGL